MYERQASEQLAVNGASWIETAWAGKQRAVCCFKQESHVDALEGRCLHLSFWDNPQTLPG